MYWKLKEEALDSTSFARGFGPTIGRLPELIN